MVASVAVAGHPETLIERAADAGRNRHPRVAVVGDIMLDRYWHGQAVKRNPEGSGVVVRVERTEHRLGGAASVAMLVESMGGAPQLFGVAGCDHEGVTLRESCSRYLGYVPLEHSRVTTVKTRVVSHSWAAGGTMLPDRFDVETTAPIDHGLAAVLAPHRTRADVVLVQDYGKGVCTPELLRAWIGWANARQTPVIVDPARGRLWSDYAGADVVKANLDESREQSDATGLSWSTLARSGNYDLIVTEGAAGMRIYRRGTGDETRIFAESATLADCCGAGDTVLAALGVLLARGVDTPLELACRAAAWSAARQVEGLGVVPVSLPDWARD